MKILLLSVIIFSMACDNLNGGEGKLFCVKAEPAWIANEAMITFTVTNQSCAEITLETFQLPWICESSVALIATVCCSQTELKQTLIISDKPPQSVSILPGESISGSIPLMVRFPDLRRRLVRNAIVVEWNLYLDPTDRLDSLELHSGMLILRKLNRP